MITRTTRATLALLTALTFTAAACGGDDDSGTSGSSDASSVDTAADTPIGQALAAEFMREAEGEMTATEEQARCASGTIVDGVGEDRLQELGVTAENVGEIEDIEFSDAEIDVVVGAMFDCIDVREQLAQELAGDFGEEAAGCVADELDEDMVKGIFRSEFDGAAGDEASAEFFQAFLEIAEKCELPLG